MAKLRKEEFTTSSNIITDRIYGDQDAGVFPFTRGVYPEMYRARFWTMRQYAGFGSAKESNKRYRYLLESGTTGLSVAFDLPTQIGYDSDHPMAMGEVGRVGVPIDSLEDIDILFDGIELEKVSTSMTINATASILLAFYVAKAKQQGADLKKIVVRYRMIFSKNMRLVGRISTPHLHQCVSLQIFSHGVRKNFHSGILFR